MQIAKQCDKAFTLLELLMAMAIFAIAGVSLAQAIQQISIAVSESIDQAGMREEVRAILLEATRNPALAEGEWDIASNFEKVRYRITVHAATQTNQEAVSLPDMYEVVVEIFSEGDDEPIDAVNTLVYPAMF